LDGAIQRCSVFATVKPDSQNGSRWMRTELSIALSYGKAILSIRADSNHLAGEVGAVSRAITTMVAQRSLLGVENRPFPNYESLYDPSPRGTSGASVT
jgi:hypothetical protein